MMAENRPILRVLAALVLLLLWIGASFSLAAELVLEVLPLRHRTVEQILPVIRPLVPEPGTVSGMAGDLVVRTTPDNLVEIRRALKALDRAPRRLLITVRQDADREASGSSVRSAPARSAGQGANVAAAGSERRSGAMGDAGAARAFSTRSASNDRNAQQVQVLEGHEATISVGYSVPVTVRGVVGSRAGDQWVDTVEYRDILSGFTVRPRLAGNVVTLEVSPQHDTPGPYGRGSMNVQRVGTTVSGRLGEWMELGAVVRGRSIESSSATYRTSAASGDDRRVLIRVEELE